MKYEITKGSEKDFDGVPGWALYVETYRGNVFASEGYSAGDRYIALTGLDKGKEFIVDDETNPPSRIIAERRPITEPELKPIYGDGIRDDTEALQQRIDIGVDVSNLIGEQGKLFNISRPLQFKPITEPAWGGEGLPPVGVECEFTSSSAGDAWHAGVVRYLSEHTIVIEFTDMVNGKAESISHPRTMKFRPLRSPEDVAREKITLNMLQYMYSSDETDHAQVCEIYDAIAAGKIKGVVLESKVADLKINITTDEMWREFEKKSDMQDVYNLFRERASRRGSF